MRYLILPLFLLIILSVTQAQAPSDALRFTQLIPGGSARMIASGGAFTALGGDFGVISLNPAGLADYRANEFVLSPSLRFSRSNSRLAGAGNNAFEEDKTGFGFDNLGIVFHNQPSGKWATSNFAIGFNRLANYGQSYYYEGRAPGSIMTPFYEEARQVFETGGDERNLYPFTSGLAWDANGLYRQDGVLSYDFLGFEDASVARSHTLSTSGGYNELSFAFAGNYNEKFLVGMNVGVPIVRYRIEGEYREENIDGEVPFFDRLSYTEYLQTSGVGFNMKLGMVYRVTPNFRMGAAFHTPTFLGLTDRYNNSMRYAYTDGNGPNAGIEQFSPEGVTDYRLRTPWRATFGGAVLAGGVGFLSADIEFVDYSNSRFNLTANVNNTENRQAERELNSAVRRDYRQGINYRFGGMLKLDIVRLRAGYGLYGRPGVRDSGFDSVYSFGADLSLEQFYVGLAARLSRAERFVAPYPGVVGANSDANLNDFVLTFGIRF